LLSEVRAEEWLLIEWPKDETEPTKYWFSTLPEDTAFDRLARTLPSFDRKPLRSFAEGDVGLSTR
jgi:hypothetical protein